MIRIDAAFPFSQLSQFVMLGLVPSIHVFPADRHRGWKDVDGRHKAGHDELGMTG
jgi:hypothetical protein